ncbi:antibiotic biosynthesis monooxygenase [Microbacterium sp. AZCO]|uniref:putative quinol monooxygenase n=1 Tax=Microbacterium sp. AZCO TaxID=3142976 RepID=UPI0031F3599E
MAEVRLHGSLVCADDAQADLVRANLAAHVALTRAEPGCLSFEVTPTQDGLVWRVEEFFADSAAFRAHQQRVAASEWGRTTAGIERQYTVEGLEAE